MTKHSSFGLRKPLILNFILVMVSGEKNMPKSKFYPDRFSTNIIFNNNRNVLYVDITIQ